MTIGSQESEQAGASTPPGVVNYLREHSNQLWCFTQIKIILTASTHQLSDFGQIISLL